MSTTIETVGARRPTRERGATFGQLRTVGKFVRKQPLGTVSAVILAVLVIVALLGPMLAPYDPVALGPDILQGPSTSHFAGTDQFGRDIFSRALAGARTSLVIGVSATFLTTLFAVVLGVSGAYFGGWVDAVIQRCVDVVQAFPLLILLLLIVAVLGTSATNIVLALTFSGMWRTSRVIRSQVLSVMANPYVEAAKSLGATNMRIMVRHLFPNVFPLVIVVTSIGIGGIIMAEASLAFLGLGVPPPAPSWGRMMSSEGRDFMLIAPWIVITPTIALTLVIWAFNMFGDALRDTLDPRLRGTR